MRFTTLISAVLGGAALALPARGQAPGALVVTLSGPAAADSSLRVHVAVTALAAPFALVRNDSTGIQRLVRVTQIPVGRYRVETRALGYVPDTEFVEIDGGRTTNISVVLAAVVALDPVAVAGTNQGHLAAFERRRAAGKGSFITGDDIRKSRRTQVTELLRSVRGLRVDCPPGGGCRVLMVRSTTCEPRYFINGFPADAEILHTPVLDVAGIEIYRGPSETPAEFMGARSMCGAIAVWTR